MAASSNHVYSEVDRFVSNVEVTVSGGNRTDNLGFRRRRRMKSLEPSTQTPLFRTVSLKRQSVQARRPVEYETDSSASKNIYHLSRGGTLVMTEIGAIQFGIPPETIKDSLSLNLEVPQYYVVPHERFCCKMGPEQGLNLAEFEFPAYFNFFMKQGRKITLVVDNMSVKKAIKTVFQETLLGPKEWDPDIDFPDSYPVERKPLMMKELKYFQKFGSHDLSVDLLLKFEVFGALQEVTLRSEKDPKKFITIYSTLDEYIVFDSNRRIICKVSSEITIPVKSRASLSKIARSRSFAGFTPPAFGVTILGSSHGFDPKGQTSGYVLWMNHRGLMVDPPPNSTKILQKNCIPGCLIDAVVITHCHADHDSGTFQKILQEGKITLITTPTIMGGFLRKYSALAGLEVDFLKTVFKFRPVRIGEKITFHGGKLRFFYTLHSIPCVGFEAFYGGKSIIFSADHMNDPARINLLYDQGILTKARRDDLLNFPWHHDLILHEAGVPPIHTPIDTLVNLSDDIKKKVYLVHVALDSIPPNQGLNAALSGCENTLVIENVVPPNYSEQLLKIDLITGIEMFSELKLKHAAEIFTSAQVKSIKKGGLIMEKGEDADSFFVIQSGVAEVKIERTKSMDDIDFLEDVGHVQEGRQRSFSESELGKESEKDSSEHNEKRAFAANPEEEASAPPLRRTPSATLQRKNSVYPFKRKVSIKSQRQRSEREASADQLFTKSYYPGDFFGESCLISEYTLREESIVAVTDVIVLQCEKKSFLSILEETDVLMKLRHLELMKEKASLDIIECNSMLRLLSHQQKTQLETYFFKKYVKKGERLWEAGDDCEFAVLIETGRLVYTEPRRIYKRRGSGVHIDMNVLYDSKVNDTQESSGNLTEMSKFRDRTSSHIHNNDEELVKQLMSDSSSTEMRVKRYESSDLNIDMGMTGSFHFNRGVFVGDVDGLFYNGKNKVGLRAIGDVSVYCLLKKDLQKFFKKNPGVLLSMLHTQFIS